MYFIKKYHFFHTIHGCKFFELGIRRLNVLERTLTVTQLNKYIKGVFEDELILHDISVIGEVSEFKVASSNTYIVLKDSESSISCYRPTSTEKIQIGTKVLLKGSVSYFTRGGRISFVFSDVKPYGRGELFSEFLELKEKLNKEGLFSRKRPLPKLIKKVAVITSSEGAAIHDFLKAISSQPFINTHVYHTKVQGEGAATELVACLQGLSNQKSFYDAVVVTRGGGGATDLSVFNDERVVRAVYSCPVPVISAVGHEIDITLCDYCADLRVGTPSMAGEKIVEINRIVIEKLISTVSAICSAIDKKASACASYLYRVYVNTAIRGSELYSTAKNKLFDTVNFVKDELTTALRNKILLLKNNALSCSLAVDGLMKDSEQKIDKTQVKLRMLNPSVLLDLGYSKVLKNDSEVVFSDIKKNEVVQVVMKDGSFSARVLDINGRNK